MFHSFPTVNFLFEITNHLLQTITFVYIDFLAATLETFLWVFIGFTHEQWFLRCSLLQSKVRRQQAGLPTALDTFTDTLDLLPVVQRPFPQIRKPTISSSTALLGCPPCLTAIIFSKRKLLFDYLRKHPQATGVPQHWNPVPHQSSHRSKPQNRMGT